VVVTGQRPRVPCGRGEKRREDEATTDAPAAPALTGGANPALLALDSCAAAALLAAAKKKPQPAPVAAPRARATAMAERCVWQWTRGSAACVRSQAARRARKRRAAGRNRYSNSVLQFGSFGASNSRPGRIDESFCSCQTPIITAVRRSMHKHYSDGSVFGLSSVTTCDYMIKYSEYIPKLVLLYYGVYARALFSSQKILQNFSDFPSHRIFRRMHGVLNIDKNKN